MLLHWKPLLLQLLLLLPWLLERILEVHFSLLITTYSLCLDFILVLIVLLFSLLVRSRCMGQQIFLRDAAHASDEMVGVGPAGDGIWNFNDFFFVHLRAVNYHSGSIDHLFAAKRTLEVLRSLVLNENFFIVEFSVAVPTPRQGIL